MNRLSVLINSGKTVFTKNDLRKMLDFSTSFALDKFISRAKDSSILDNIYYGIYTLNDYDTFEFASKLKKKSYISFETVLQKEGIIFQDYSNMIFLASDDTLEKKVNGKIFKYNKIKDSILLNPIGLVHKKNYIIASKERAICDRLYLSKNYFFDNLDGIDLEKLREISQIYNKRVILDVNKIINYAK